MPYSGPLAPPTFEIRVMATAFMSAPTSPGSSPSSFSMTARIPRSMLMPWSASPIAWSSRVSSSLFSATTAAKALIQDATSGAVAPPAPEALVACVMRPSAARRS